VQNRKDLLQAHRLMTQRAALALICGDPDSPDQPLRRLNVGWVSGVLAGAVATGIFVVLGLLAPGHATGLTQPGTLVVDKNTATPYVPCQDGKLCPALNYASALLALDSPNVNQVAVSQASLSRYPIGPTIGIAGLPQDLPTAADLVQGPWSVCEQAAAGPGSAPRSTLVGGRSVAGTPLGPRNAVLVTAGQGDDWVLWDGQRLAIAGPVMLSLFGNTPPQDVPAGWLDALPQGSDFAAPAIAGQGTLVAGPAGGEVPAGQVFFVAASGPAGPVGPDFVALANGQLASISPTQAELLEREPGEPGPQAISPSELTAHLSGTSIPDHGLPVQPPALASTSSPLCIDYGTGPGGGRLITSGGSVPAGPISTGSAAGPAQVDQVWLPSGHGALIGALGSPGSAATTYFLLDGARRYALSAREVASVLGYQLPGQAAVLPAAVLDLVPAGPALDPAVATQQAPAS
jgi:type VII secretion protein EccB